MYNAWQNGLACSEALLRSCLRKALSELLLERMSEGECVYGISRRGEVDFFSHCVALSRMCMTPLTCDMMNYLLIIRVDALSD